MREILFRGKRIDNGEWVEGAYFPDKNGDALICTNIIAGTPIDESAMCITWGVDPATIGQYTGLTDRNGQKIFEGDVVLKRTYLGKKPFPVTFGGGMFHCGFGGGSSTALHRYSLEDKQIEVIGNIHDNPELMEGELDG